MSCEVLPRSGAEQELPLLPLEGRRMEEFVDPFLNPRSLLNSNEQEGNGGDVTVIPLRGQVEAAAQDCLGTVLVETAEKWG